MNMTEKELSKLLFLLIKFRKNFINSDASDDINCVISLVEDELDCC